MPWGIVVEIKKIKALIIKVEAVAEHEYRESNKLTNFIVNQVFFFVGADRITYLSM